MLTVHGLAGAGHRPRPGPRDRRRLPAGRGLRPRRRLRRPRFATPGVRIGLFCTTPMVEVLRAVGRARAMEMLLTGDPIDAATAADWGLVNRVVEPEPPGREAPRPRGADRLRRPRDGGARQARGRGERRPAPGGGLPARERRHVPRRRIATTRGRGSPPSSRSGRRSGATPRDIVVHPPRQRVRRPARGPRRSRGPRAGPGRAGHRRVGRVGRDRRRELSRPPTARSTCAARRSRSASSSCIATGPSSPATCACCTWG